MATATPNQDDSTIMLDAALALAAQGWAVFPCGVDKKPLTEHGFLDATTDADQIRRWWTRWPNRGIGTPTGAGLLVLDVDPKHGGQQTLDALLAEHGRLPDTLTVLTGGGGTHYYFSFGGEPIHNQAGNLGQGLDIRGDGGYVIVPPSPHPSGNRYQWEASTTPETPIAPCPQWLLDAIRKAAGPQVPVAAGETADVVVHEGERNAKLASLAGAMRRQGASLAEIETALVGYNDAHCQPPLETAEVQAIAKSIGRYKPAPPSTNGHPHTEAPLPVGGSWAGLDALTIEWDWRGWLPRGLLTMLAGEQGTGKSALALAIAMRYVLGGAWPDGTPFVGERGSVLWLETEAAQAVNVERARLWGLPLDQLVTALADPLIDVRLDDPEHRQAVITMAQRPEVRLVVVDSLRGAHRGKENDSESISIVLFLAELARNTGKPILAIHHLRKANPNDPASRVTLDRLRGSSAMTQPARVVWALDVPDATRVEERRLSVIKSNIARWPPPLGLTVDERGAHFGEAPEPPRTETAVDRAAEILLALLKEGPKAQTDLENEAKGAGLSWRSFQRAKDRLHIVSIRKEGRWLWALP